VSGQSLYDKVWQAHMVREADGQALLYIDLHLIHEVTSPQPFDGLRLAGRKPWRVSAIQAVPDHNVPTLHPEREIEDAVSRAQVEALERNCAEFGIRLFGRRDPRQGIVHVIGPEQGLTLPGMTIVCGDSHTSTHGAFAALAFGIGTSEVEHVLATQCLPQKKTKSMRIVIDGDLQPGVYAKDMMLAVIRTIGTAGGTGYTLEFADEILPDDLVFEGHGVKVFVDPKSHVYLDGTELDFTKEGLQEGFKFANPNVKNECGCGESFNV